MTTNKTPHTDGHESRDGMELQARLQEDESEATLDCGCLLTDDSDGAGIAAIYMCRTHNAAADMLALLKRADVDLGKHPAFNISTLRMDIRAEIAKQQGRA